MPSVSSEANASASACAQSMLVRVARRRQRLAPALELFDELRVHGEAVGHPQQLLAELAQARRRHRRLDLGARRAVELVLAGAVLAAVLGGRGDLRLQPLVQERQVVPHLLRLALDLLLRDDALGDQAVGPQLGRRASCVLIFAYISGWV